MYAHKERGYTVRQLYICIFTHTCLSLQLGLRRHYVHPPRGLPAFLASQADGDATQYNGG